MKTIVIGLGNPILGDDAAGWQVAALVEQRLAVDPLPFPVEVDFLATGGLSLMERLVGYQNAIIVDAITGGGEPGDVRVIPLDDLPSLSDGHTTSVHDTSLQTAIRLGKQLGAELPANVIIVGIEASEIYEFKEEFSPAVQEALPRAVELVIDLLRKLPNS